MTGRSYEFVVALFGRCLLTFDLLQMCTNINNGSRSVNLPAIIPVRMIIVIQQLSTLNSRCFQLQLVFVPLIKGCLCQLIQSTSDDANNLRRSFIPPNCQCQRVCSRAILVFLLTMRSQLTYHPHGHCRRRISLLCCCFAELCTVTDWESRFHGYRR